LAIKQKKRTVLSKISVSSRGQWTYLTDILQDWIIAADIDGVIQYANKAVENATKMSQSDLVGTNVWKKFPEMKKTRFYSRVNQLLKTGKIQQFEHHFKKINRWFNINLYPVRDGVVVHMVDISDQKKLYLENERNTAFLRSVINEMPAGIIVADAKTGKAILFNKEIEKIFRSNLLINYNTKEYNSWVGYKLDGTKYGPEEWPMIRAIKRGEEVDGEIIRIRRGDGTVGYVRSKAAPIKNKKNKIIAGVVIDSDVSKLIEMQKELMASKQEFKALADNSPDVISRFDKNLRHLYINPAIEKISGIPASKFIGKTSFEIGVPNEIAAYWECHLKEVFKTGKTDRMEYYINDRFYQAWLVPEFDNHKKVVSVLSVSRDMTEMKELERKKDEFISMASHELKTPLTSIKVFTEIIRRSPRVKYLPQETSQLKKVHQQINKLEKLISDLLDVSRIQAGKLKLRPKKIKLNKLISEIIEVYELSYKNFEFEFEQFSDPVIFADKDRIGQVINNLIQNAIKYSPNSKKIHIKTRVIKQNAVITIKDFGIGIDKKYFDKIFNRFYRVYDNKESTYPGMGMGLYIASEIIKMHKGRMHVESQKNKGSEFSIYLPLDQ
jgi:PAS domain S-box-containing protein